MRTSKRLNAAVMEIVANQLRAGDPPQTRQTYDRLKAGGLPDEEVRRLIGCVVVNEIFEILKLGKPYDAARFVAALERLPQMPKEWGASESA
jgi:hypothetical protein